MSKKNYALIGLAMLLFASLIGFIRFTAYNPRPTCACAPPLIWERQADQLIAHSSTATFSLKFIAITPREFHFFYAFQSSHQGRLHVVATSLIGSKAPISLITTVQSLGQIGAFTVGVVHASRVNRVNQTIGLEVTPPGKSATILHLAPLRQVGDEPHPDTSWYGFFIDQIEPAGVLFYGPVVQQQLAYFSGPASNQQKSSRSYVFLRMDDPIMVSVITQAQYISIAGPENFKP